MSSRRGFLIAAAARTAALASGGFCAAALTSGDVSVVLKNPVPCRRGFTTGASPRTFSANRRKQGPAPALSREDDFRIIRDWGFDLVRIMTSYWDWVDYTDKTIHGGPFAKDLFKIEESGLTPIDDTIDLARKYNLHFQLEMHRAPGYVSREILLGLDNEPFNLWTDEVAQRAFVFYWDMLAKRYRGIGAQDLSFDLVGEPQRFESITHGLTHACRNALQWSYG